MLILNLQSIFLNEDRDMRYLDSIFYLRVETDCLPEPKIEYFHGNSMFEMKIVIVRSREMKGCK